MVTAYPVAGKQKCIDICTVFARACGGRVAATLQPGDAFFFGVNESNVDIWRAVVADPTRSYYFGDNSYFDSSRQTHFRVTKNALQHPGTGTSNGRRFRALNLSIQPWRRGGSHVVLCPQSDDFMRTVIGSKVDWTVQTLAALESLTKRPLIVRSWNRDKAKLAKSLGADLDDAHALVTWSSAAAITAVLSGVPVVTLGQCAAEPMSGTLQNIESLPHPERENWAGVLADNQWTLPEVASGMAWRSLNG